MSSSRHSRIDRPENSYWLTRRWMYEPRLPTVIAQPANHGRGYAVDRSGRALTAGDRGLANAESMVDCRVRELLKRKPLLDVRRDHSDQAQQMMRPITAKLLELMWNANGEPVGLENVCQRLWGRPTAPTYHTFHATVHKANAALRRAGSPLRLKSRLNQMIFVL